MSNPIKGEESAVKQMKRLKEHVLIQTTSGTWLRCLAQTGPIQVVGAGYTEAQAMDEPQGKWVKLVQDLNTLAERPILR